MEELKKDDEKRFVEKPKGRPKSLPSEKKNQTLIIRMTKAEKQLLEQKSKLKMRSMSDYVRDLIFEPRSYSNSTEIQVMYKHLNTLKKSWDYMERTKGDGIDVVQQNILTMFKAFEQIIESNDSED